MHDTNILPLLEVVASLMGIAGAALLATRSRWMHLAWPIWLVSNGGWLAFALLQGYHWLALQQGAFAVVNVIGLLTWRAQRADVTQSVEWKRLQAEMDRHDHVSRALQQVVLRMIKDPRDHSDNPEARLAAEEAEKLVLEQVRESIKRALEVSYRMKALLNERGGV